MTGTAGLDWLWHACGAALAIAGLALLVWALLWDRARGRMRCPKCWYDMQGAEADDAGAFKCPECGRAIRHERKLRRTRRRWRWVLPTCLLLIGAFASTVTPKAKRDGVLSLVPNAVLPHLLVFVDHGETPIAREVKRRVTDGQYAGEELTRLYEKLARGDFRAPTLSERWRRTYGRIIRTIKPMTGPLAAGQVSQEIPEGVRAALMSIPPMLEFRTRPVWPVGAPLYVEVRSDDWWPRPYSHLASIHAPDDDKFVARSYGYDGLNVFAVPWVKPGDRDVRITYRIVQSEQLRTSRQSRDYASGVTSVPIELRGTIEDLLTPVRDPDLTAALAAALKLDCLRPSRFQTYPQLQNRDTRTPAFVDIAIAGILEFSANGQVWAEVPAWWMVKQTPYGFLTIEECNTRQHLDFANARPVRPTPEAWTVRFRSDPEIALRVIDATKYWEGEIDVPVVIRTR